jgi:drug/metabolite transporter (DMT)-like permease
MTSTAPPAPAVAAKPQSLDWALLAVLIIVWGSAYAMTHVALEGFAPLVLVAIRLVIGAAALGCVCLAQGERLPPLRDWKAWLSLLAIGLVGTLLPFGLISEAQARVPSALAAIYIAAAPLAVAVMAHVLVPGEKLSFLRAIGVLLGFCGILVLFAPGLAGAPAAGTSALGGLGDQLMLLAAAVFYGTASILVRLVQPNLAPIAMSFGFVLVAALVAVPVAWVVEAPQTLAAPPLQWACAIGLGLGSTALGNLLYVIVIRRVGPVFLSNVGNLVPFWSLLVGAVLLGEALPGTAVAGLAVILAGIWLVQKR